MAAIPADVLARLKQQSRNRCGYCRSSVLITGQPLTVEHLTPTSQGGSSEEDNLWLSCRRCNEHKGAQTHAVDTEADEPVPLFNPRRQAWQEHFAWSEDGTRVMGLTPPGRTTVSALNMNHEDIVSARRLWVAVGWHPPND